jgi:hypothetical protein
MTRNALVLIASRQSRDFVIDDNLHVEHVTT